MIIFRDNAYQIMTTNNLWMNFNAIQLQQSNAIQLQQSPHVLYINVIGYMSTSQFINAVHKRCS